MPIPHTFHRSPIHRMHSSPEPVPGSEYLATVPCTAYWKKSAALHTRRQTVLGALTILAAWGTGASGEEQGPHTKRSTCSSRQPAEAGGGGAGQGRGAGRGGERQHVNNRETAGG